MTHDTYVISKINARRDCQNTFERFLWISKHKNLMDTKILVNFEFPSDAIDESISISSMENTNHKLCTIGILTTYDRVKYLIRLLSWIRQIISPEMSKHFNILVYITDRSVTVGEKRNTLVEYAKSDYFCFIDDDDMISESYFFLLHSALIKNPDGVGIMGKILYFNDDETGVNNIIPFVHNNSIAKTIRFDKENDTGRFIGAAKIFPYGHPDIIKDGILHCSILTHLCPMKLDIVKTFKFEHISYNEDLPWAKKIYDAGLVKNEMFIDQNIYQYCYRQNKLGEER